MGDLVRSTPTALSTARYRLVGVSVGDYALFGGGYTGNVQSMVDAYNTSLTSTPTAFCGSSAGSPQLATMRCSGAIQKLSCVVDASHVLTRSTPTGYLQRNISAASVATTLFGGVIQMVM